MLALLSPFDALRRALLTLLGPWARVWLVDRERRVALVFAVSIASSLVLASAAPLLLLALGPILLGVPHLLSDVRYLVVRHGLHRRASVWGAVLGPLAALGVSADVRWGWVAMIGAALVARGPLSRRAPLALAGAVLLGLASKWAFLVGVFIAHFHNLFAVGVLFLWRPKRLLVSFAPFALYVVASAIVLTGAYRPVLALFHGASAPWTGLDLVEQSGTFAPPGVGALGVHLVVFFAFAQSVHYGLWLRAVPDEARPSKTPRSFRQSARVLTAELGLPLVVLALAASVGLAAWAAVDLVTARDTYFRFAMFHGYLEFAAFTLFFCERSIDRAGLHAPSEPAPAASGLVGDKGLEAGRSS